MSSILASLQSFSIIEWVGLFSGIVYVALSAQNKIICWYFGIVSCACIAYHDFFGGLRLYSDGLLQLFYIVMGFIGLIRWRAVSISFKVSLSFHFWVIFGGIFLSMLYGYLMKSVTEASFPIIDAYTTVFGIIATVFLVNRQLSAWIYFVIINIVMTYLYYYRGYELYGILYLVYTFFAVYGVWNWIKLSRINLNK